MRTAAPITRSYSYCVELGMGTSLPVVSSGSHASHSPSSGCMSASVPAQLVTIRVLVKTPSPRNGARKYDTR